MCLVATREMSLGTQVAVEFTPPSSGESLRLRAWVRNRHGYRYGLEFLTREKEQVHRYRCALRLQAMQSQIAAALTLCSTAEHLLRRRRFQEGRKAIDAARQTAQFINQHVVEPTQPADSIPDIRRQLAELESRICSVASRCEPATKWNAILRQADAAKLSSLRSSNQAGGTRKGHLTAK